MSYVSQQITPHGKELHASRRTPEAYYDGCSEVSTDAAIPYGPRA